MSRALALGRLLRVSLAPSALADIAAGTVLAAGVWPSGAAPFVLMLASACVYHGGMALNDWADRAEDARNQRPRPIPRAELDARAALAVAVCLLLIGPALAFWVEPHAGFCLAFVALVATLYDLCARGPWLGPLCLGICRAGNLATGLFLGLERHFGDMQPVVHLPGSWALRDVAFAAFLYGLYVFYVSRLARLEDASEEKRARAHPGRMLVVAAFLLVAIGALRLPLWIQANSESETATPLLVRTWLALLIALTGALGLLRKSRRPGTWSAGEIMAAVGMALRRLLVATAALAVQAETSTGLVVAALILCGYPLSFALRRLFPPT